MWRICLAAFWVFAIWMLFWNIFRIWPGERLWPVALVNYFTPWFGLILIPLLIISFLAEERILSVVLLIAFILIAIRYLPYLVSSSSDPPPENSMRVMAFNIFQRNSDLEAITAIILEQDPDILALQELTPEISEQLLLSLEENYPYHTLDLQTGVEGQGLFSRYPINQVSDLPDYNFLSARVETPSGPVHIFNIHTPTLFPTTWDKDIKIQRSFIEELMSDVGLSEEPVIVLGDFNTTPQSENYAILTSGLTDAFTESGRGLGFGYPARPKFGVDLPTPIVRIDYIFINPLFKSFETRVLKESGGSDHRPVITSLILSDL